MILDKKLDAIIDQNDECLIINESRVHDVNYAFPFGA